MQPGDQKALKTVSKGNVARANCPDYRDTGIC